ncbi:hypothetical protein GCM10011390_21750 [Aureimonas endophytica]|uniref:Uncharacterized protein n=1 Tax=Aureimonas endophytica TaxID=2027858 RepID=A0A916ZLZ8_9HYPH|nr:hypothetical protein [Aureimonas endophytica]GGE02517.1 hypothetical protein GCM10011390_21750 [Aureimonas endophytica]
MTKPTEITTHADGTASATKPENISPPTSNGDLAALIGRNGLTVIGAVTFLLSIPANTLPADFAKIPIFYGYGLVGIIAVCGYVVLGGFERIDRKSIAGFVLLVAVACIFATPPLFSIWDSARQRAPDASLAPASVTLPDSANAHATPTPSSNANTLQPFSLEITQR